MIDRAQTIDFPLPEGWTRNEDGSYSPLVDEFPPPAEFPDWAITTPPGEVIPFGEGECE